jgi:hypothetical protein
MAGCGGGGSSSSDGSARALTSVNWYFENRAPDLSSNGATCVLVVEPSYSETIAQSDIAAFTLTSPNGWHWTINAPNIRFRTTSTGKEVISTSFYFGQNPQAFPLAGTWTAALVLTDGSTSTLQKTFREPGNPAEATHPYLFTQDDWTPSTSQQEYVSALMRFPAAGYSVQYSSTDGGKITTTGLAPVMTSYLQAEPRAYNLSCWLYDQNKTYIGSTTTEYSNFDHTPSSLITGGELSIVPAATTSATASANVDLGSVKFIRVVSRDGAQFTPASYGKYDYRSISSLVPVY